MSKRACQIISKTAFYWNGIREHLHKGDFYIKGLLCLKKKESPAFISIIKVHCFKIVFFSLINASVYTFTLISNNNKKALLELDKKKYIYTFFLNDEKVSASWTKTVSKTLSVNYRCLISIQTCNLINLHS